MCFRTRNRTGRRTAVRNQQSCGLLVSPREIPVGSTGEALLPDAVWVDVRESKSSSGRLTSRPVPTVQWTVGKSAGDSPYGSPKNSSSLGWGVIFVLPYEELLRRRPPPAADTGSRSRAAGRRSGGPPQGPPSDAGPPRPGQGGAGDSRRVTKNKHAP